jgi:hypothetical protein
MQKYGQIQSISPEFRYLLLRVFSQAQLLARVITDKTLLHANFSVFFG